VIAGHHPENVSYRQFENSKEGCSALLFCIKEQGNSTKEEWLFCGVRSFLYRYPFILSF
jgi:hypothetical protein